MKKLIVVLFILVTIPFFGQSTDDTKMGRATLNELKMTVYEKDSSANALILDEKVFIYSNPKKYYSYTKDYYVRIKFFNKEDLDRATFRFQIRIPNKSSGVVNVEGVDNVEGITYNLSDEGEIIKTKLDLKTALKQKTSKTRKEITYLLPNVKDGSVIEFKYSYTTRSYGILDIDFQSSIPKIKMDYELLNATEFDYYIRLSGMLKPTSKELKMKKKCVRNRHECYYVHYTFDSIPAFYEEGFMTSREDFISKLVFERDHMSRTETGIIRGWPSINKRLRDIYRDDLSKENFFKRRIPDSLVNNGTKLKIATAIYKFIQNHFTSNRHIGLYGKVKFNKIYKEKSASISDINLSLVNALNAFNIDAKIGLLSTRGNGKITKLYASHLSFNYPIVVATIEGKEHFLDASRKYNSFGQLSFWCLNGDVRVLDLFNKSPSSHGGYWSTIKPITNNKRMVKSEITFSPDNGVFSGKANISSSGYYALDLKESIQYDGKEEHLTALQANNPDLEIIDYNNSYMNRTDRAFIENINYKLETDDNNIVRINPIQLYRKVQNPFKLKERLFPVDYGYNRKEISYINFIVPEGYSIKRIPESIQYSLPNRGGNYLFRVKEQGNKISILSQLNIAKYLYSSDEYFYLKELYNKIIKAESSYIELEKTD